MQRSVWLGAAMVVGGLVAACSSAAAPETGTSNNAATAGGSTSTTKASTSSSNADGGASTPAVPAPTPTEVCGGPCAAGAVCIVDSDCASGGCRAGVCAVRESCKLPNGGGTCGAGEVGDATAKHEDCCITVDVPKPDGDFKLDKYLITAGRMRVFLQAVNNDVKTYVANDPPPGWDDTFTKSVPGNRDDVVAQLGAGQSGATSYGSELGPGCFVSGMGAPAYWMSKDEQAANGDMERAFSQSQLDTKVMNCATRALFTAFCHWDGGGRLPTNDEWQYAVNGGDSKQTYPWGTDANIGDHASYNFNYSWPGQLSDTDVDRGAILPAPGRFANNAGPFGHMDLAGAVENFTSTGGVMQYSFQEAGKEQYNIKYGTKRDWDPSTKHWAVGARCAFDN